MKAIKSVFALMALCCAINQTLAQDLKSDTQLDLLAAPVTPAAAILGISPSEIDKPRESSQFLASVINSTNNLNSLPTNYAVEFAPAWMFTAKNISFDDYMSNKMDKNLWQNLTVSAAVRRDNTLPGDTLGLISPQVAFGLKSSILRGSRFSKAAQRKMEDAQRTLKRVQEQIGEAIRKDETYLDLLDKSVDSPADSLAFIQYRQEFYANFESPDVAKIQKDLQKLRFERIGFKMDITTGIVNDFPTGSFDKQSVSKYGAWLTMGYDWEKGFTFIGLARYLKSPNALYEDEEGYLEKADISNFDAGFRAIYAPIDQKFTVSTEAIYRSGMGVDVIPSSWRMTLNAEYKFKPNLSFNFAYGRDFDGLVTKDGNVIALLSLFTGLGNAKPVTKAN